MGKILDIAPLKKRLMNTLLRERKKIKEKIALASFCFGKNSSVEIYISVQKKLSEKLGVEYRLFHFSLRNSLSEILSKIETLNKDEIVKGVIIHRPLPSKISEYKIFSSLSFYKDIEGVTPYNLGRILLKKPLFISPTVLSILRILEELKISLYGKDIVLVGFSSHIGKPLATILLDKFATVSITHIATYRKKKLPFYLKKADIIISCVGKPKFLKADWIKKGAVIVDVGISSYKGKICGDVDDKAVKKAGLVTPVPGGVGSLTPLYLFLNLFKASQLKNEL